MTPEVLAPVATTIINPHVTPEVQPTQPKAPAKESSHRVADGDHLQRIKVVNNPFVTLQGE